jgi:hypothetical protein
MVAGPHTSLETLNGVALSQNVGKALDRPDERGG